MNFSCKKACFALANRRYFATSKIAPLSKEVRAEARQQLNQRRVLTAAHDFYRTNATTEVRRHFATLINTPQEEQIALLPSASYAMALALHRMPLQPLQNIIIAADDQPRHQYLLQRICDETAMELLCIPEPPPSSTRTWSEAIIEAISPGTAVVQLSPLHWLRGTQFDLCAIARCARENSSALFIDASCGLGILPLDVAAIRPDLLVADAWQSLLGPYGIAAAYFGTSFNNGLPFEETGNNRCHVLPHHIDINTPYRTAALRYDAGGFDDSNLLVPMFARALRQLLSWGGGGASVLSYCSSLASDLAEGVSTLRLGVQQRTDCAQNYLTFELAAHLRMADALNALASHKVVVDHHGRWLRMMPHVWNDRTDVVETLDAFTQICKKR